MKKDTLKAFFENENVTKIESMDTIRGGQQGEEGWYYAIVATNDACTSGDVGCCDDDHKIKLIID